MNEPNDFMRHIGMMVVSGGQTGVDVAGLRAAQCLGFKTGGWAPLSFKTTSGPKPQLAKTFKLQEHSGSYASRTIKNVDMSNITLIIAADMESAGTKLTIEACERFGAPYRKVQLEANPILGPGRLPFKVPGPEVERPLLDWMVVESERGVSECGMFTVNIAGNSSLTAPGIFPTAFLFLTSLFGRFYIEGSKRMNTPVDATVVQLSQKLFDPNVAVALNDNYDYFPDLDPRNGASLLITDSVFTKTDEVVA